MHIIFPEDFPMVNSANFDSELNIMTLGKGHSTERPSEVLDDFERLFSTGGVMQRRRFDLASKKCS